MLDISSYLSKATDIFNHLCVVHPHLVLIMKGIVLIASVIGLQLRQALMFFRGTWLGRTVIYKWLEVNYMSRKLKLLIWIITISTFGAFMPPVISWLLTLILKHPVQPLTILTDGDWVTVISLIVSAYMGVNVAEKHVALSNGVLPKDMDVACKTIKAGNTFTATQEPAQNDDDKEALKDKLKHD